MNLKIKKAIIVISSIFVMLPLSMTSIAQEDEIKNLSGLVAENIAPELSKKRIAVVDFLDTNGQVTELGKFIAEEVYVALVNQSKRYRYRVLNRKHINRLLEEHKIALSGLANPETAAEFGQFTLANVIVTGTLVEFGEDRIRVSINALAVDTAEVIKAERVNIIKTASIDRLFKSRQVILDQPKVQAQINEIHEPGESKTTSLIKEDSNLTSLRDVLEKAVQLKTEISNLSETLISKYEMRKKSLDAVQSDKNIRLIQATVEFFEEIIKKIKPSVTKLQNLQNNTFLVPQKDIIVRVGDPAPGYKGFNIEIKHDSKTFTCFWEIKDSQLGETIEKTKESLKYKGIIRIKEVEGNIYKMHGPIAAASAFVDFPFNPTLMSGLKSAIMLQYGKKNDFETELTAILMSHPLLEGDHKIELQKPEFSSEINLLRYIELEVLPQAKKILMEKVAR